MGCTPSAPRVLTDDDKLSRTYKRARLLQNLVQQTNKVDPLMRYEVVKKIGIGSMGYVSTVRKIGGTDGGHLYAMKTLRPGRMTGEFIAELKNEIRSVRRLDHPNIVRFHEVYYGKQISIIMDYCAGGDVYGRMPYTEVEAASIVKQVLAAVRYMHQRGYVHLDIKCENIMFSGPEPDAPVKVIDFGFATRYDPSNGPLHKQVGTFDTMAPEVYGGNYTTQADLWSVGVVAYELVSGKKPFAASSQIQIIGKVALGEIYFNTKIWKQKSNASREFVKALIQKDPKRRLDAEGALAHKWMRDVPAVSMRNRSKTVDSIGDEMLKYGEAPTLKRIGLLMIAHKTFPEEIVKLREHFTRFDVHNRGVLTKEDFGKALHEINREYTDEEIQKMFHSIATNGSEEIAYTEFVAATLEKYLHLTEDRIDDAFERIDVTNSGFISIDDLRLVLGRDFSEEKAIEIISQMDRDGDGKVSHQEFLNAFRKDSEKMKSRLGLSTSIKNNNHDISSQ